MGDWKKKAEEYYFESHLSISDIAALMEVSRQSVSASLKQHPGYWKEKERRKQEHAAGRREYKTRKQQEYRNRIDMSITGETLRREHDIAAAILSREKHYHS